jgi:hypothetical protein
MGDDPCPGVELVQACVLCADPYILIVVFTDLPDGATADGGCRVVGIIFLKGGILPGVIIYAAEISSCPYAAPGVFAKGIDGVVGEGIGIEEFFPEVGQPACVNVQYEYA